MSAYEPIDAPGTHAFEDPEAALRDARQRFIAAFPKRADSIGFLLNLVLTVGPKGPVGPLVEIVHRTAGLAGTVGFPSVSAHARTLEDMLDGADRKVIDAGRANAVYDALRDGFSEDLATPPAWVSVTPRTGRPRRILVVEDDEDQREVLSIQLRAAGYVVVAVAEGDKAVDAARDSRPDLVLLDANLPGLDGFSVCRQLKADPDLTATPVIFTTVRAKVDDKAVGLLLGADEYLTKPLDLQELVVRISVLLDRKAQRAGSSVPFVMAPDMPADLDYESFVVVAREQLAASAAVLSLVRLPEPMLMETFSALRGDLRRRDIVACFDPAHLVLLMENMPPAKARDRLTEIITGLGVGSPPRFRIGLAHSPGPGAKSFEALLAEADEAIAAAFHRGSITAISGEEPPAAGTQAAAGKILIADDDPEVIRLMEAQLRSAGYQTVVAHDGGEAMAAIDAFRPDVVIVDIMMPKMTGVDVLSRLHHTPGGPRVIVLSARGREQDITRAFALGADDYVTKPFSPQELLARIERLLRSS